VTPAELRTLLLDFYRELRQITLARQTNARSVAAYDANNAYQQVLGRQDTQLQWVSDAIADMNGSDAILDDHRSTESAPAGPRSDRSFQQIVRADIEAQRGFIDRWRGRIAKVTNARHRRMLELILGEMFEHLRVFEQALSGRTDVLGRHADGKVLGGQVLPARPSN
jgi:alkylhydroperoxidase family enzyme